MENIKMEWADTTKKIVISGGGGFLVGKVNDVWVTSTDIVKGMTISDMLGNPTLLEDFVSSGLTYDTL